MTMFLNDRNTVTEFKLITSVPKGFIGPPPRQDSLVTVPGRVGQRRVSTETTSGPRRFTVEAAMQASSAAEARTLWDTFVRLAGGDEVEVRFSEWPDLVGYARYEGIDTADLWHVYQSRRFTLSFVMPNPLKYARYPDVYSLTAGLEVPLVLGSAPSDVQLRFVSTAESNPQVLYKDAQGLIRGDVHFALDSVTFPIGQWIDYNPDGYQLARQYAIVTPNLVVSDAVPIFGSPWGPFVADPDDGDGTQGPTLMAINCQLNAMLRQAWL
jgi:hypothetical protein